MCITDTRSCFSRPSGTAERSYWRPIGFAGLSIAETAEALDVSPVTVERDWTVAKAWLLQRLTPIVPDSGDDRV